MEIVTVRDLTFAYPGQSLPAVSGIALTLVQGEFMVLCGPSGSGKSTLLRLLKPALSPVGACSGEILFQGDPLSSLSARTVAGQIGFVGQRPDDQLVTDKVWHELAFGLENLGMPAPVIRRKVAEMAAFFGIQSWFDFDVAALSGGQKQLLNLASVMVMEPQLLLLDEPTAMLDPIAAGRFLEILGRLHRELGITVLLTEHRLDEALPLADRLAVLDNGRILCVDTPRQAAEALNAGNHPMFDLLPVPTRVWASVESGLPCPLTAGEGSVWLRNYAEDHFLASIPEERLAAVGETVVQVKDLWFRYARNHPDVIRGLNLSIRKGELFAILGDNGGGKTTALSLLAGLNSPQRGKRTLHGRTALLPQDPQVLFLHSTLQEDLSAVSTDLDEVVSLCGLNELLDRHPYDLSGGEQQRAALAKVLLTKPDILLLDEPTSGLDPQYKARFGALLQDLTAQGKTVVLVSHDVEFCARYASRCALLFRGEIAAEGSPREFFSENRFYTTAAVRMAHDLLPDAITPEDIIHACGGTLPPHRDSLPPSFTDNFSPAVSHEASSTSAQSTLKAMLLSLLLVTATLFLGLKSAPERYYLLALAVLFECMLPFFLRLEERRPHTRDIVLVAALCALGVVSRAALFMLPEWKPVLALVILTGASFGTETGFLVGSLTMLVSNMFFAQGPWTPWQMFAMGLCGAGAGMLTHLHLLPQKTFSLCVYGVFSAIVLYGIPVNVSSALLWAAGDGWKSIFAYCLAGLPMDCVHALATVVFLWIGTRPMLEKFQRVKLKYGFL